MIPFLYVQTSFGLSICVDFLYSTVYLLNRFTVLCLEHDILGA